VAPSIVIQEFERYSLGSNHEKTHLQLVTINCAGRQPDSYKELLPVFERKLDGFEP
jgi:hypothetical protein